MYSYIDLDNQWNENRIIVVFEKLTRFIIIINQFPIKIFGGHKFQCNHFLFSFFGAMISGVQAHTLLISSQRALSGFCLNSPASSSGQLRRFHRLVARSFNLSRDEIRDSFFISSWTGQDRTDREHVAVLDTFYLVTAAAAMIYTSSLNPFETVLYLPDWATAWELWCCRAWAGRCPCPDRRTLAPDWFLARGPSHPSDFWCPPGAQRTPSPCSPTQTDGTVRQLWLIIRIL